MWCPFDTNDSFYVKDIGRAGHAVISTHINDGNDFFKTDPINCDYIISNPPYTLKSDVLQRLFEIGTPFAMLVGVNGLFDSKKRYEMFKRNEFEIMYLSKRVAYCKDRQCKEPSKSPPFMSVYICKGMLPFRMVFEDIIRKAVID